MEFEAAIQALSILSRRYRVTLFTDSMTLIYLLRAGADKAHKRANQDLVQRLLKLIAIHEITPVWVKGHAGHAENERCDQLAMAAIRGFLPT